MSKELKALDIIKNIELSHLETSEDENYDGEWEYTDYEEYDGTIEENYPEEIKILETALKDYEKQDNLIKVIKETIEFGIQENKTEVLDNGDISITGRVGIALKKELDEKERTLFRNWILETCFSKELKALEIIKEKKVYPSFLLNTKNLEEYNKEIIQKLTSEEFNLLKEVLK